MSALTTDLYELTMAAGYFLSGKQNEIATFELSVRKLPSRRNFMITAGLQQAVEYLLDFHFTEEEVAYLRTLEQLSNAPSEFFDYLKQLRFEGDIFAMPEGTPAFPGEPLLIVRAPLIQAQLIETYLLSTIAFQTTVASKAIRCVTAAEGRPVVEFGSRRAHTPEAGILAGRAAYIAGCAGTSNTQAGMRYGIPVFGTAAHPWTIAFPTEGDSVRNIQRLLGDSTVYLVDTYDTLAGTRLAASLGHPIWGVRLDSGNLAVLSSEVRRILDETGHPSANIMATNELDEDSIAELVRSGAPIDAFGVGTALATSSDAPSLSAVYKLVELQSGSSHTYTAKYSAEKNTLPAAKQVELPTRVKPALILREHLGLAAGDGRQSPPDRRSAVHVLQDLVLGGESLPDEQHPAPAFRQAGAPGDDVRHRPPEGDRRHLPGHGDSGDLQSHTGVVRLVYRRWRCRLHLRCHQGRLAA